MSAALLGLALKAKLHSQTRKMVLIKLVDCCHEDGTRIYPSLATIAEDAECSVQTARRVMQSFVRVGLLRLVREGGAGARSTNHYEMDVDMLARLRRRELWPALEAAAEHQPLGDSDDDEDGAPAANPRSQEPAPTQIKGITVEGYHGDSLPNQPEGYHQGDTQPLSNNPYPEREGAQGREGKPTSEGKPADAQPAATLDEFMSTWPDVHRDSRKAIEAAWAALPFAMRRAAIDQIKPFLADLSRDGHRKYRPSAATYLGERRWTLMPQRDAVRQACVFSEVRSWSRQWWLMLLHRMADGQRQKVSLMLQQADAGKSISVAAGDLTAAAKRIGELKTYLCHGREIDAWRPWLAERGARIPVFDERSSFRVFLPSETPPRDAGGDDDNVRF